MTQPLTVDELDQMLAEKYAVVEEVKDVEESVEEIVEEVAEEVEETIESVESEDEEIVEEEEDEVEEEKPAKRTKDDKKDYAFAKMRKEAQEAKREAERIAQEKAESDKVLRLLMAESGYDNFTEFKMAIEAQVEEKEIERRGITREEYRAEKHQKQTEGERERLLEEREKALLVRENAEKANRFNNAVKSFSEKYQLGEKGTAEVYVRLQKEGFTVEDLMNSTKPEVLIRGVMTDYVENFSVSKHIETKAKRKTLDSGKLSGATEEKSIAQMQKEMLAKELKEYEDRKYGR